MKKRRNHSTDYLDYINNNYYDIGRSSIYSDLDSGGVGNRNNQISYRKEYKDYNNYYEYNNDNTEYYNINSKNMNIINYNNSNLILNKSKQIKHKTQSKQSKHKSQNIVVNKSYNNEVKVEKKVSFLNDSEFLAFELYNQIRINKQIENLKIQIAKDHSYSSILRCFNMIDKNNTTMNINNFEAFLKHFNVFPIFEELELLFNSLDKSKKGRLKYLNFVTIFIPKDRNSALSLVNDKKPTKVLLYLF